MIVPRLVIGLVLAVIMLTGRAQLVSGLERLVVEPPYFHPALIESSLSSWRLKSPHVLPAWTAMARGQALRLKAVPLGRPQAGAKGLPRARLPGAGSRSFSNRASGKVVLSRPGFAARGVPTGLVGRGAKASGNAYRKAQVGIIRPAHGRGVFRNRLGVTRSSVGFAQSFVTRGVRKFAAAANDNMQRRGVRQFRASGARGAERRGGGVNGTPDKLYVIAIGRGFLVGGFTSTRAAGPTIGTIGFSTKSPLLQSRAVRSGVSTLLHASALQRSKAANSNQQRQPLRFLVNYISKFGRLPDNYITKSQAQSLGWVSKKGNLDIVAPGKMIGGDIYRNLDGKLPSAPGRIWREADIAYTSGFRNGNRLVYSNDGLIYITRNHYRKWKRIQ